MAAKHSLFFPKVELDAFSNSFEYRRLQECFYKQNSQGYLDSDIDKQIKIQVNEFDSPDRNNPPVEVEKEVLKDFLIPVLQLTELKYARRIQDEYYTNLKYGDTTIIKLKEKHLKYLKNAEIGIKESKYLVGGLKKPVLDTIQRLKNFTDEHMDLMHLKNSQHHKIDLEFGKKDSLLLLIYLNEKGIFKRKLENNELAEMASIHFKYKVGKNSSSAMTYRSASKEISRALNSTHSYELPRKFNDYIAIIDKIRAKD